MPKSTQPEITQIVTADLRALLFWASVGVRNSTAGSYSGVIENIIEQYASDIKFQMHPKAVFKSPTQREG